jgi:hypothetical protein
MWRTFGAEIHNQGNDQMINTASRSPRQDESPQGRKSRRRRLAFLSRADREMILRAQKKIERLRKERAA